jgi:hypothetical protein
MISHCASGKRNSQKTTVTGKGRSGVLFWNRMIG